MLTTCPNCQENVKKENGCCPICGCRFVNASVLKQAQTINTNTAIGKKYKNPYSVYHSAAPLQVTCPKCGSTQIQLIRKKWSLLTGFLTNKTERVCLNCQKRF